MPRIRSLVVGCAVVALAAGGTAHAETQANQSVGCDYGQRAEAKFTEAVDHAAWEYWVTYTVSHWWGTETKDTTRELMAATKGTHTIAYTSPPQTRIDAIHVRSSDSVEGAGGEKCTDGGSQYLMHIECGDSTCDTVVTVVGDTPVGVPVST
jgi:hypothetical protein